MKKYHLTIIFSNTYINKEIEAESIIIEGGCIKFYDIDLIAAYPINRTLITKIEKI
jgi:hypothetical protein